MREFPAESSIVITKGLRQGVLPGYEELIAGQLTDEKIRELELFFTNVHGRVTAIIPGPRDITAGVVVARASRAQEPDFTELFWKEFRRSLGEDVGDRVLNEYGDDSVREEASGYLLARGVSILTTMQAFAHPLVTGIEASTRYINWGNMDEEGFSVRPENVMRDPEASSTYVDAMRASQNAYRELWPIVWDHIVKINPRQDGQSEGAYKRAVKGAVCDSLRALLPLGIKTSFGIHATYRTLSEVIMNLRASNFEETRQFADEAAVELKKVNPVFIRVVDNEHGAKWTQYQRNLAQALRVYAGGSQSAVRVSNSELSVAVQILNGNWLDDLSHAIVGDDSSGLTVSEKETLVRGFIKTVSQLRTNRRDKLPGAVNSISVLVDIQNLSFGSFKDFNRHRPLLVKGIPDMSGQRGWVVPSAIEEIGVEVKALYMKTQRKMMGAKSRLEGRYPEEAKLLLTHGMKTSYEMTMGLGELFWIAELRSVASNHPENRRIAISAYRSAITKIPILSALGGFVDQNRYDLGRIGEAVRADLKGK